MNPYEKPSSTTISAKCLKLWGTQQFASEFLSEMVSNESDLPLEDFCQDGGQPSSEDVIDCNDLVIDGEEDEIVTGHFDVYFKEVSPTGCRDMPRSDDAFGRIDFELNLEDGKVTFERPTAGKREYDPEEL